MALMHRISLYIMYRIFYQNSFIVRLAHGIHMYIVLVITTTTEGQIPVIVLRLVFGHTAAFDRFCHDVSSNNLITSQ